MYGILRVTAATVLLLLPGAVARGEDAPPAPAPTAPADAVVATQAHRYFRIGLRAQVSLDRDGGDGAVLNPGIAAAVPVTLDFAYGLGMRLAFSAAHYTAALATRWNEVPGDTSTAVTYVYPFDTQSEDDNRVITYGLTAGFNYEVTVPKEPFFKVFQPFFGVGVAVMWVRTHPDVPAEHDQLIDNELYEGADSKDFDPWSLQVRAGLDVYGGFHINVSRSFRFPIEFGYRMVPVPESTLMWATEGYDYAHLEYLINTFNVGGGLEWLF